MHKFFVGLRNAGLWLRQKAMGVVMFALVAGLMPTHFVGAEFSLTNFATAPATGIMLLLAAIIQVVTAAIGKLLLLLIESIVIPILGYNGFYTSHIVSLGWSLTRDTVNMFVVAILIFIACATIIGYSKANWMQQLPKLFLAIVFVNFSKLICGALIDVSQVIMFTFVNAIVSIAAGNFSSMFSLSSVGTFSDAFLKTVTGEESGVEASQYLIGAYLQFVMVMSVFAVMFLLAVAFIWRIVILWVLIIMAPLAFFAWGIGDMLHFAAGISSDWWKKMVSALTFGPIMAFFLWLALAASSGANIVNNEAFPMPDSSQAANIKIPNESFELANFLGTFIAIAILLAGIQQASTAANAMGGFASKALNLGTGAMKGLARSPADALGGFRRQKDWINKQAKAGGTMASTVAPEFTKYLGKRAADLGTQMQGVRGLGALGGVVGGVGASVISGTKETSKAEMKRGEELSGKQTDEQKLARRMAQANKASGEPDRMKEAGAWDNASLEERNADTKKLLTDPEERTKYQEDLAKQYEKDELAAAKNSNLSEKEQKVANEAATKLAKKRAQNDTDDVMRGAYEYSESDVGKNALAFGAEEKKLVEKGKAQNLHLVEPKGPEAKFRKSTNPDERKLYSDAKRKAQKELLTKMKDEKTLDIRTMSTAAFEDEDTRETLKKFETEKDVYAWDQFLEGKGTTKQQEAAVSNITANDIRTSPDARKNVAQLVSAGAVGSAADLEAPGSTNYANTPIGQRMNAVREHLLANAGVNSKSYGAATAKLLSAGSLPNADATAPVIASVLGDDFSAETVRTDDKMKMRVNNMLQADASSSRHLASFVPSNLAPDSDVNANDTNANFANSITESIATNFKVTDIERLRGEKVPSADREKNERALTVATNAVRIQHARAVRDGDKDAAKRLADKGDALGVTLRYKTRPTPPAPGPDPYSGGGD